MSIFSSLTGDFSLDHEEAPYDYYTCKINYYWNSGKTQLPIAMADLSSDPPEPFQQALRQPCAIVQTSAPFGWKLVRWFAQRLGEPPHVPPPDPSDDNFTLIDGACTVDPPMLNMDAATQMYRAEGYYLFAMSQPIWFRDGLPMGRTPYDVNPDQIFGVAEFDDDLD